MIDPVIESRDVCVDASHYHIAVSIVGLGYIPRWSCNTCDGSSYQQEPRCDTCQQAISVAMIALFRHHDENHKSESASRPDTF